jgi:hypothetical protein
MTRFVLDIDDSQWKADHLPRVLRTTESEWLNELACQVEIQIADGRSLIVLAEPEGAPSNHYPRLVAYLRRGGWDFTADQIEAQTKPVRIPEPGLWGVVEASWDVTVRTVWVHDRFGWASHSGQTVPWVDLIDPTLVREGVAS